MKYLIPFYLGLIMLTSTTTFGQRIADVIGDFSALEDEETVNIIFTYEHAAVGDYPVERDYVEKKIKEINEDEPGEGDRWAEKWYNDREDVYNPTFTSRFNEMMNKKSGFQIGDYPNAAYTLILSTVHFEPGYNAFVSARPAHIRVELILVKTETLDKELGKITSGKLRSNTMKGGLTYDTGTRLGEAYKIAGKALATQILKEM